MKKNLEIVFISLLLIAVLFVGMGQEGCSMLGTGTQSNAGKTGVDFSLISRVDTLTSGKSLQPGETFYIGIKVENYDMKERQIELCIKDTILDQYGGITGQGECQQVSLQAAEKTQKKSTSLLGSSTQEEIVPGTKEVYFPQNNQYAYSNFPKMNQAFPGYLIVTIKYPEKTEATAAVSVPDQSQSSLIQEPSQIYTSLSKSVYAQGDSYKVNLDLNIQKNTATKIYLQDYSEANENKTYFNAKLTGKQLDCRATNNQQIGNILEIKDSRTIKCSTVLYQSAQRQDYDLIITYIYNVVLERNYAFSISTKG